MQLSAVTHTLAAFIYRMPVVIAVFLLPAVTTAQEITAPSPDGNGEEEVPPLRRYSVELIVFENGSGVASGNEIFLPEELPEELPEDIPQDLSEEIPQPLRSEPIEFTDRTDAAIVEEIDLTTPLEEFLGYDSIRLQLIDPEEYTMTGIYERLDTLDAYRPVLHSGWIQAAFDEPQTPAVRLRTLGTIPLRFDGNLTLYLSRYLHLIVDLSLEEEQAAADRHNSGGVTNFGDSSWTGFGYEDDNRRRTGPTIFRINENRIVADGDLRFFDHPKFGILAKITRLEDQPLNPDSDAEDIEGPDMLGENGQ